MRRTFAFLSILLAVSGMAGIYFFVRPAWEQVQERKAELGRYQRILAEEKRLKEAVGDVIRNYEKISDDDIKKLDQLVPKTFRGAQFIASLDDVARKNALILTKIGFKADQAREAPENFRIIEFTADIAGRYGSMKDFLRMIEKSATLIDVTALKFAAGEQESFPFQITGRIYAQSFDKSQK